MLVILEDDLVMLVEYVISKDDQATIRARGLALMENLDLSADLIAWSYVLQEARIFDGD